MLNTRILSAFAAIAIMTSATAAFAATPSAAHLSKAEVAKIKSDCKASNKTDAKAYKACVKSKEESTK